MRSRRSPGFFEVFRRAPLLGRTFADHEYAGRPSIASGRTGGQEPILVLSHHLWQSLGADPALVGGTVHVEGRNWRVLGVMPADFAIPDASAAFWTPWDIREAYRGARFPDGPPRDFRFLRVALKDGAPISGQRASRVRRSLVVAEIAVTVVLLAGAGLLVRSFAGLQRVDPGFDVRNLLVLRIAPDVTRYRDRRVSDYYGRVLNALRELPGVASAAAVTVLPMSTIGSDFYRPYWLEGARPEGHAVAQANVRMATPGYFATLGLPLVSGREFSAQDEPGAPPVIIVNESLARSAWKGQDPVGRTLVLDYQNGPSPRQVVGVVRDARYRGPRSDPAPEIFIPHAQNPYLVMNVVVRTTIDPGALARTARTQAMSVDPDQPVHSVTTMERLLDDTMQQDRFAMLLVAWFAAAALVTAVTGMYALLAYTVAQRKREIAVRLAIGASSFSVARSIVMESVMLAVAGGLVGAVGVAAVSRLARSVLFGIAPQDPVTLATTAAVLLTAVLAASWLPARRAARINPVSAMRI